MNALTLTLLLSLGGLGAPARNARPSATSSTATGEASAAGAPSTAADPSADLSDAEVASRARTLLHTIDTPVSVEHWRALGPRAVAALEAAARDGEELPTRRARAVSGLTAIGDARSRQVVTDLAVNDSAPYAVRAAAVRGAGRLLAPKELERRLRPVLERSPQSALRATAAEVLAERGPATACATVRAQVARERTRARDEFRHALARCGSTEP